MPEESGDVVELPLVLWSAGGGVALGSVAEPGAVASGLVVASGELGGVVEASGDVVLGSVVVSAGAFGAVEFCFWQPAAVKARAPKQSRRTLRFIMYLSLRL